MNGHVPHDVGDGPDAPDLLARVRVLDLTAGLGETSSRLLADLGADVVRVADPNADPGEESSGLHHRTHNVNKRGVAVDPRSDRGRSVLVDLVASSDIVFANPFTGPFAAAGLDPDDLRRRFPTVVVVLLSDFGLDGPYRDWATTDRVHAALGGMLSRSGVPGREPLLPPGRLPTESAAVTAAWAGLVAYYNRLQTGAGDLVDVSVLESTVQILDPGFGMAGSGSGGVPTSEGPRGRPDAAHVYPIFPCRDGQVRFCILSPRQWDGMVRWMGEPEELTDPALRTLGARFASADVIQPRIARFLADKTRALAVEEAQAFGVPAAALLSVAEVLEAEHFRATEAFTSSGGPDPVWVANGPLEVDGRRSAVRRPAPRLGEHDDEVLGSLAPSAESSAAVVPAVPHRPLAGLRVLDFGVIVAGGESGRLLADMGAEVIKIENSAFPDGSRQTVDGRPISPVFAWGHRNKASLGVNLRDPRGIELLHRLVAQADVVLSNFKPGTMDKLGLSHVELARTNPRIVVAESSAFGGDGPWSRRMGYGPLVRASTGLSAQWRYPGPDGPYCDATTIYPDHVAARMTAIGVVAQLVRRLRTGRGGTIGLAQAQVILMQQAELFARVSQDADAADRPDPLRTPDAPRGLYAAAGDDEWVVVDVRDTTDWQRLAACLGRADLIESGGLGTPAERWARRDELDRLVGDWIRSRSPLEATRLLQAAGVPAGLMRRLAELVDDEHLRARGTYRTAHHPLIDHPMPSENTPAHFANIPDVELRPAPLLGEQTRELAARLLGLDPAEIEALVAEGVLEETRLSDRSPALASLSA